MWINRIFNKFFLDRLILSGGAVFVGLAIFMAAMVNAALTRLAALPATGKLGDGSWWHLGIMACGLLLHAAGLVGMGLWAASGALPSATSTAQVPSVLRRQLFDRHLAVLGFYLLCVVLTAAVALGYLLSNATWQRIVFSSPSASTPPVSPASTQATSLPDSPTTDTISATRTTMGLCMAQTEKAWRISALFYTGLGLSMAGALFFVANRLSEKRDDAKGEANEPFRVAQFWSGLLIYMSEAALLTLVVFFAMMGQIGFDVSGGKSSTDLGAALVWLPAAGLIIGMLVKPAETLIFGLANRLLAAFRAMLGAGDDGGGTAGGSSPAGPQASPTPVAQPTGTGPVPETHANGEPRPQASTPAG
jgi:hypothetical protein